MDDIAGPGPADISKRIGIESNLTSDLSIVSRPPHPNALLIGTSNATKAAVAMLLPSLACPVAQWDPSVTDPIVHRAAGTLVIWNVERLTARQQSRLLELTDAARAIQVVSIATDDIFELVQRGEFQKRLYYRLNTVLIRVNT